jgi:hypothetical protein
VDYYYPPVTAKVKRFPYFCHSLRPDEYPLGYQCSESPDLYLPALNKLGGKPLVVAREARLVFGAISIISD